MRASTPRRSGSRRAARTSARRAYGTGRLYTKRDAWYGHWRTSDDWRLSRRVGPVRSVGEADGLTRREAERQFRRMQDDDEERRPTPVVRHTVDDAAGALRQKLGLVGSSRSHLRFRARQWIQTLRAAPRRGALLGRLASSAVSAGWRSRGVVASAPVVAGSGRVPIRVILADDSAPVVEVLADILRRSPDIDLIATAIDEPTLLAAIEESKPDVVVTDVRMPPTGTDEGVRVAERLITSHADVGVVILSQYSDPEWLGRVFDHGSEKRGWVMKERVHADGQLVTAVKTVHAGSRWIDPSVLARE